MRNQTGLTNNQIEYCQKVWKFLTSGNSENPNFNYKEHSNFNPILDTSRASIHSSKTVFDETHNVVFLGADAYPGTGLDPNDRMSTYACLAHEFAHAERFYLGFKRPLTGNDKILDEAETSLHASFYPELSQTDRTDLILDSKQRIQQWEDEVTK